MSSQILWGGGNASTDSTEDGDVPMKYITIGIDTRISLGDEDSGLVPICWNEGDQLLVNKGKPSTAVTKDYNGKSTAVIGVPETTSYPMTLVYPYAVDKGAQWCYIPTKQTYKPELLANGYAILMGVADKAEDVVMMEHKCGYMRVSLTGSTNVKSVMLRTIGHEPLSGYFRYPTTETKDGKIDLVNFNRENIYANGFYDSPIVFIDCSEKGGVPLSGEPTEFTFALPARTYSKGFALTVIDTNGMQQCVEAYTEGKEVKAGALIDMPELNVNCNEEVGIYNGNEFAGYVRTLEKNLWLNDETTLHIRGEINLTNEEFGDIAKTLNNKENGVNVKKRVNGELLYYRFTDEDTYNCDAIECIDGHDNAIVGYNSTATGDAALFMHTIPATLTIQNLTLGKQAKTTDAKADCKLTVKTAGAASDAISYVGGFCHTLLGKIENCNSYATVDVAGAGNGMVYVGGFAGTTDANSSIINSKNYGYIDCNLKNVTGGSSQHLIGGIVPTNPGTITTCENAGTIEVVNTATSARLGGVVGQTVGALSGCINSGNIILTNPQTGCRVGGVTAQAGNLVTSCTNTGSVTVTSPSTCYIGGVVGTNAYAGQTFDGCVNGDENDPTKGAITATFTANNIYIGGVCGYTNKAATFENMTNYGSISVEGTKTIYFGGVIGYSNLKNTEIAVTLNNVKNYGSLTNKNEESGTNYVGGILGYSVPAEKKDSKTYNYPIQVDNAENHGSVTSEGGLVSYIGGVIGDSNSGSSVYNNCQNLGEINVSKAGAAGNTSWNYVGGVFGRIASGTNSTTLKNEGNITVTDCIAKLRVGGVSGYLSATKECVSNAEITVDGVGAESSIGGLGGYIPGKTIQNNSGNRSQVSGKITITDKVNDRSVCVGGLFGTANGPTIYHTDIKNFTVTNNGVARCGLITASAAGAGETLTIGKTTGSPLRIAKTVTFLGVTVTDEDSISDRPVSNKVNLLDDEGTYQLDLTKNKITIID